jgi:hypothetical protein
MKDKELIEAVAAETAHLANRHAWQAISARLDAAGLSKHRANTLRENVWRVRRHRADAARINDTAHPG